jgi:hypothetical protein
MFIFIEILTPGEFGKHKRKKSINLKIVKLVFKIIYN